MTSINSASGSGYNPAQYNTEKTGVAGQAAKKAHHHHGGGGHKAAAPTAATAADATTSAWSTPGTKPATGAAATAASGVKPAENNTKDDKTAMASVDGWPSEGGSTLDVLA